MRQYSKTKSIVARSDEYENDDDTNPGKEGLRRIREPAIDAYNENVPRSLIAG